MKINKKAIRIFWYMFWAFVIFLIISSLMYLSSITEEKKNTYNYTNIVSLERGTSTEGNIGGSFVLGFGTIKSETRTRNVYYAYGQYADGLLLDTYYIRDDSGINLYIIEDNSESPKYKTGYKNCRKYNGFFTKILKTDRYFCDKYRKIIVPVGTIRKEFNG